MRKWNFLFIIAVFCLSSCTVIQKKQDPKPAPAKIKNQFNKIEIELAAGSTQKALRKLQKITKDHVDTDIADDAWIMMGDIYYGKKQYQQSYDAYMKVIDSEYYSPKEVNALLGASNSLLNLGRLDESLGLVNKALNFSNTPLKIKTDLHHVRFQILDQLGDRLDALYSLVFLVDNTKDEKKLESLKNKAFDYVESRMSHQELETIANDSKYGFVRKYALFNVATTYFEQKDFNRAKDYYEDVIELAKDTDMAVEAQKQIEQINARREVAPMTVGTILPISGRHSRVAYKTLKGLKLGLGIYGDNPSNFKLAIIDSESNPDASRRAVERLVVEDHVIAIVGSLLSKTSSSVASKANELGVPVISLSQKSGLTEIGDSVFRNALTSSLQVQALVKTAMEEQGLKRFAILYPNDAYGIEFSNIFWDEVNARGGKIVAAQSYKPNETDFNGPIKRLVGKFYIEARDVEYRTRLKEWYEKQKTISRRLEPPSDLLPPIVDFDAIFIPDHVKSIGQIAPTISYNDIGRVKLIGTNLWNNHEFVKRGQSMVENSLFVDTHLKNNNEFRNSEFYKLFKKVYGYNPGLFEAQAYDAGLLIRQQVLSGETSRVGLRDELSEAKDFNGSFGKLKMSKNRELSRPLVSLTVHQGEIMGIHEVPEVEKK